MQLLQRANAGRTHGAPVGQPAFVEVAIEWELGDLTDRTEARVVDEQVDFCSRLDQEIEAGIGREVSFDNGGC